MWSRIYLIPLLQAEEDRDLVRRTLASQAMEKELLGAETKVYNSDRYVILLAMPDLEVTDTRQLRAADLRSHTSKRYEVDSCTVGYERVSSTVHTTGVLGLGG